MSGHIAALSDSVTRKRVVYQNRYGLDIAGELYLAKDMDPTRKHSALVVGAPYGGVKEQGPCVYGDHLAQRGSVVLTFDQSFMGESGGFPRNVSSLFVAGDRAHSKFFSEDAYAAAQEPKELYTVTDAEHIDLYDRADRIPFDKLAGFSRSGLNQ